MKDKIKSILENYALEKIDFGLSTEFNILNTEYYVGSTSFELEYKGKRIDIDVYHENNQITHFDIVEDTDDYNYAFEANFSSEEMKNLCQRLFSVWADTKRDNSEDIHFVILTELKNVFLTLGFKIEESDMSLKVFKNNILIDYVELVEPEYVKIED